MSRTRTISLLTLILFALIVLYHTYLDVTGLMKEPKEVFLSFKNSQNQSKFVFEHFEIYMFITFFKFLALGSLVFLCYYNRQFFNTILMWLMGTLILIIESCIRILSDQSDHLSLIITLNFVGLVTGYFIMYILTHILYNLITDVSLNKD